MLKLAMDVDASKFRGELYCPLVQGQRGLTEQRNIYRLKVDQASDEGVGACFGG